jgi:hypothetical protein
LTDRAMVKEIIDKNIKLEIIISTDVPGTARAAANIFLKLI